MSIGNWIGRFLNQALGGDDSPSEYETALSDYSKWQMQKEKDLYDLSSSYRNDFASLFSDVLSGEFNPAETKTFANVFSQAKSGIEGQYNNALENILSKTARGGAQTGAIAGLEMERAKQSSALPAQISQNILDDMMNKAFSSAYNEDSSGDSGASSMSDLLNYSLSLDQMDSSANASILNLIGSWLGS